MAKNAIKMTSSMEEATNLLLTDPDSCKTSSKEETSDSPSASPQRVDELFTSPGKVNYTFL